MGATIAAKALVILALLGAGATGIYAVANKGFGSGKQTERTDEEGTRADTSTSAKSVTATEVDVSAPAGTASGTQSSDGQQPPVTAPTGTKDTAGGKDGTPSAGAPAASGTPSQTGGSAEAGGGNGPS